MKSIENIVGIIFSSISLIYSMYSMGFHMILYLTQWTLIASFTGFILLYAEKGNYFFVNNLFSVSWTLGFNGTIQYWGYIYPLLDSDEITVPLWHNLINHGGLVVIIYFLAKNKKINPKTFDFRWTLLVSAVYIILVLIPARISGVIIYPKLLEDFYVTIIIFLAFSCITLGSFLLISMINS